MSVSKGADASVPPNVSSVATALQHAGSQHRVGRGLVSATEQSVTFHPESLGGDPIYARLSNTANNQELCEVMAAAFGSEAAFVTCSGMAALHLILSSELAPGDEIICQEDCYGSTRGLLEKVMTRWGVVTRFAPAAALLESTTARTRAVLCETISNPFCQPLDVPAFCHGARERGVLSIVDNTFASPYLLQPSRWGADYVWESATKYLNGHSDQVAGVVATTAQKRQQLEKTAMYLGSFLDSDGCVRVLRGMRTFALRMERHSSNGLAFAQAMSVTPGVARVDYGAMPGQGSLVRGLFSRGFGGMLCLRFDASIDVPLMCQSLALAADVPSLGGTETTVCMPLHTTHKWSDPAETARLAIDSQVLRVSVGLESPEDIIADFRQAIAKARQT
jgi:cystathionine beta-lyase/cystathionine gamma-synthase